MISPGHGTRFFAVRIGLLLSAAVFLLLQPSCKSREEKPTQQQPPPVQQQAPPPPAKPSVKGARTPETLWSRRQGTTPHGAAHIVGDFNGDMVTDIAFTPDSSTWSVILSNGRTLQPDAVWGRNQPLCRGTWAGDFNGDGLCDKLTLRNKDCGSSGWFVGLSMRDPYVREPKIPGYRFFESRWSSQPLPPSSVRMRIGDFDGNGADDILFETEHNTWDVVYSTGSQFQKARGITSDVKWDSLITAADFDDDGKTDLAGPVRGENGAVTGWWVARARITKKGLQLNAERWSDKAHTPRSVVAGDFTGDSRADLLVLSATDTASPGSWNLLASNGKKFEYSGEYFNGQTAGDGVWCGDFSGDGIDEKITARSDASEAGAAGWWLARTPDSTQRKVGVFYFPSYYIAPGADALREPGNLWNPVQRDIGKIPVAGWGKNAVEGYYSSQNPDILRRQLSAMRDVGIDFVLTDITNGIGSTTLPKPSYHVPQSCPGYKTAYGGDGLATNGTTAILKQVEADPTLPRVAATLGFEFWGRTTLCAYAIQWDTWNHQVERQKNAVDFVRQEYVRKFPKAYLRYLGKPLLLITAGGLADYPWRDENFRIRRRPVYPDFTLRYGCEWGATYAGWPNKGWGDNCCALSTKRRFIEGVDTKRLWSWGAGARDDSRDSKRPLPTSTELMTIMPGSQMWTQKEHSVVIDRRGGAHYIDAWKQVLVAMPRMVLVTDWNNWNEETAIEGCRGPNGWKDLNGKPTYDWYLQITAAYTFIFKNGRLPDGIFFRQDGDNTVYSYSNSRLTTYASQYKPDGKPIIQLPAGWISSHLPASVRKSIASLQ